MKQKQKQKQKQKKKFKILNKYYFKNYYYLTYSNLINSFPTFFNRQFITWIEGLKFKLIDNTKKQKKKNFKNFFKFKIYLYLKTKNLINKFSFFKIISHRVFKLLFNTKKLNEFKFLPDSLPFLNSLKTSKIQVIKLDNLINYYGHIYLKSSGINTFVTLTNSEGNV